MISTVTTTIVTIVGATLGALSAAILLLLLGTKEIVLQLDTKEIATAHKRDVIHAIGQHLNIVLLPFLTSFLLILCVAVINAL